MDLKPGLSFELSCSGKEGWLPVGPKTTTDLSRFPRNDLADPR